MASKLCSGISFLTVVALSVTTATAQGEQQEAAEEAIRAVHNFFDAWNTGDNVELRKTMHFPFVTMFEGNVTVAKEPQEFSTDFKGMRARDKWSRSSLDAVKVVWATSTTAFLEVDYSRHNTDNERYFSGTVVYLAIKKDGAWRLQFRMPG